MDFSSLPKKALQGIADELGITVESEKDSPTKDELICGLEDYEQEFPDEVAAAWSKLNTVTNDTDLEDLGTAVTYIGQGEDPPRVIDFMGQHRFIRGQVAYVKNGMLLEKICNNPCFVMGEVGMETLHENDAKAKELADEQRRADIIANARFTKQFKRPERD